MKTGHEMPEIMRSKLRALSQQYLAGARGAHQFDHTLRVVANVISLAKNYPDIDQELLEAAAWLHDIGRGISHKKGQGHAAASAKVTSKLGPELGFTGVRLKTLCAAIADHSFSAGRVPESLEGKLLQDADRLDALGAVGIARTFAEGFDRETYHLEDPFAVNRPLNDDRFTLDHFSAKLLMLAGTLHTAEAKAMARRRTRFLRTFLNEFRRELAGE